MEFKGRGAPLSARGVESCCTTLGVSDVELWTVIQVETGGCGFFADRRPKIRFERHWFATFTSGQFSAEHPDVSSEKRGGSARDNAAEYVRLAAAMKLDRLAALKSASWGLGQIMGFNAVHAGFADAGAMIAAFVEGEDAQARAMATFIAKADKAAALREHRWDDFAAAYNGPRYKDNDYDTRLAAAYDRLSAGPLPDLRLRAAQLYLGYLGFDPRGVDGILGNGTRQALRAFQAEEALPQTGALDATTEQRLRVLAG
ncbi:MAG: DUF3380 domain-containing protein [Alphaproteobacteria bacterium]|nr:DUF3380 domain-containing protein [Alphaproteobacteria bacterium]